MMRKLFAATLVASLILGPLSANDLSIYTLQSGSFSSSLPLHDRGLFGQGQIIAMIDSGVDYDNCFFAEADNRPPPINTGSPSGGLASGNVDLTRRKIVAYDFLFSCDQYPGATGCDDPSNPLAYDNINHGTHTAGSAAGDRETPIFHDRGDAIAPGAKLIIQDGGYVSGDSCTQLPGIGCPITGLVPALDQAYRQGARIHSSSWGDRQGVPVNGIPPTANYSASARDVDAFAAAHPDMLIIFNAGNAGSRGASSVSAPGVAKNVLQVGGTRDEQLREDTISQFSGIGPTRDGRIKPDLVAPAFVEAADAYNVRNPTPPSVEDRACDSSIQSGTSYAAPTLAGAAALVRQYYVEGFYPSGAARVADRREPSAALLKATLIASARPVPFRAEGAGRVAIAPPPSGDQGFGFPVLGDALYFPGDRSRLQVLDRDAASGLREGGSMVLPLTVRRGSPLKAVLVWTDPPGLARTMSDPTPVLVNDLDLRVIDAGGNVHYGNEGLHPGAPDRINNVEAVSIDDPGEGSWRFVVSADRLRSGATQSFALVIVGDVTAGSARRRAVR